MSDRGIIFLTLGLNGGYLVTMFGFMGLRMVSGLAPLPSGYGPLVWSAMIVPVAITSLGTFLRLRWGV